MNPVGGRRGHKGEEPIRCTADQRKFGLRRQVPNLVDVDLRGIIRRAPCSEHQCDEGEEALCVHHKCHSDEGCLIAAEQATRASSLRSEPIRSCAGGTSSFPSQKICGGETSVACHTSTRRRSGWCQPRRA